MASDYIVPTSDLIVRADRAIADAMMTRRVVREGLVTAGCRVPYGVGHGAEPKHPPHPVPLPWTLLEPWWSVARTLTAAQVTVRAADEDLERGWNRILPTIETPMSLLQGER